MPFFTSVLYMFSWSHTTSSWPTSSHASFRKQMVHLYFFLVLQEMRRPKRNTDEPCAYWRKHSSTLYTQIFTPSLLLEECSHHAFARPLVSSVLSGPILALTVVKHWKKQQQGKTKTSRCVKNKYLAFVFWCTWNLIVHCTHRTAANTLTCSCEHSAVLQMHLQRCFLDGQLDRMQKVRRSGREITPVAEEALNCFSFLVWPLPNLIC